MNEKSNILLIFILFLAITISKSSFSQDTILLVSGDKMILNKYTLVDSTFSLNYFNKRGKEKTIDYYYIFSITDSTGKERIFFEPSKVEDIDYTIPQMRSFINGEIEARKTHKARIATASGFVVGAGAMFLLPTFYSLLIPATNSFVVSLTKPNEKKIIEKYPEKANDKYFINGYIQAGKEKRINNSIKSGLVGILTGIGAAILYASFTK